ncbi:FAD-dependent oxidoreductase domain-containing protein 1-like [Acropora millepora]|uniref:FAD-dependent oxidoreductase domain-containing protein 1-like n=1 Tax=Acropora millepora TaxID=45264 RepID=UPI001CF5F005|nr:FAD-dependent oxidoreductase domain-containing protein 1-like [Acropora millepora]
MAFLPYYFRTRLRSGKRWSDLIFSRCFVSSRNFCSKRFDGSKTYDVAIIGGGIMGSSSAYFLANRMSSRMNNICVIERDPTYEKASTVLAVAGIRQQFSVLENIQMSKFSFQFLSDIDQFLAIEGCDPPDIQLQKLGYMFLASKESEQTLRENHALQSKHGCHVLLLSPDELSLRYPWMNTDGVALASLGADCEGYLDPWSLLNAFKRKSKSLGVDYITGEATDFIQDQNGKISGVQVATGSPPKQTEVIHCGVLVNAAGPSAGYVAKKLGIDLPIEPRKRCVYVLDCPRAPAKDAMPFIIDYSGVYLRHEGCKFIAGGPVEEDWESSDFEVDYDLFYERYWQKLAYRIPAFECLKVQSAWAGHYEYNTLDQNAIIGRHPQIANLIFVNGFSGHGLMQSPAAGRAVSEIVLDGKFQTIDLTALGFERFLTNTPVREKNII